MTRVLVLLAILAPRLVAAQLVGVSLGHVSATVDWQVPPPPASCSGACVVDESPHADRTSFAPALAVQWRPSRLIGLSSELRYTEKGYAVTEPTLNVDYVEVPALLRVGALVEGGSSILPFLELGPALALRVRCEVDDSMHVNNCVQGTVAGQDWRIRRYDVSAVAGGGVSIRVDKNAAVLGARIDRGLLDIGGGPGGVPTKHRSSLIYLAWLWALPTGAR